MAADSFDAWVALLPLVATSVLFLNYLLINNFLLNKNYKIYFFLELSLGVCDAARLDYKKIIIIGYKIL